MLNMPVSGLFSPQKPLPFPRFVYGTTFVNGELRDDEDQLVTDQTPRNKLVIELLDGYEVVDIKVRSM